MCESHAYILRDDREELIMEDVVRVAEEGGKVHLSNIIGEENVLDAEIASITFLDHKIILRPR